MGDTFCFSKDLKIILYGVNAISRKIYGSLKKAGYHVAAFFDKRYKELKDQCPIPVYELSDNPYIHLEKDNLCVIILLQNAMQHEKIAESLLRQGYQKILFAPVGSRLQRETEIAYRILYNIFLSEQFDDLIEIPLFQEKLFQRRISVQHSIIREDGNCIVVWCPIELLYTGHKNLSSDTAQYANIPIVSILPYNELFHYLQGNETACTSYLNKFGVHSYLFPTRYTDVDVLIQRKQLLEIYSAELNYGMDFFISSAPMSIWNSAYRVFNLIDGHHRCSFLAMQGFRFLPIRISKSDLSEWDISDPAGAQLDLLIGVGKALSILHPKYKLIHETADRNNLLQLESIQNYLITNRNTWFENQSVLDASDTYGYYARNALRMRATRAISLVRGRKEVTQIIHTLEGFPYAPILDNWDTAAKEMYDAIFVLNALADLPLPEKELWIDRYADACQGECFVTMREAREMGLWKRHFSEIHKMRNLFDRGELVGLYVLKK